MSDLFSKILTGATKAFHDAAGVIDADWAKLVKVCPGLQGVADAEIRALKQQASNAFAFVDTELAPKYADAVSMAESAADTLVMAMTHGSAGVALPLMNVGMSQGFALLHAALDHAEAAAKAGWSLPPPTSSAKPTVAGLVDQVAGVAAAASAAAIAPAAAPGAAN